MQGVDVSKESAALTTTLLRLGSTQHLQTIAEGIEDAAQLRALKRHRCDQGQGCLFAEPRRNEGSRSGRGLCGTVGR